MSMNAASRRKTLLARHRYSLAAACALALAALYRAGVARRARRRGRDAAGRAGLARHHRRGRPGHGPDPHRGERIPGWQGRDRHPHAVAGPAHRGGAGRGRRLGARRPAAGDAGNGYSGRAAAPGAGDAGPGAGAGAAAGSAERRGPDPVAAHRAPGPLRLGQRAADRPAAGAGAFQRRRARRRPRRTGTGPRRGGAGTGATRQGRAACAGRRHRVRAPRAGRRIGRRRAVVR